MATASGKRSSPRNPAVVEHALPEGVKLLESSADMAIATLHDVMLAVWRKPMSLPCIDRIDSYSKRLRSEHAHFCVFSAVEPSVIVPPDAATRAAAAQLSTTFQDCCVGVAMVLEGTGIKHMVLRMAISTINLVASSAVEQDVFDTIEAASRWLGPRTRLVSENELVRAMRAVRAHPVR
jgi:hypothetical protein